ncbi:MAG: HalOD1 output domain-containing protein [Halobacteriaceae archaeon]
MPSSSAPVSVRVVTAVADATDTPVESLPPLGDVVDPEAVDDLFSREGAGVRLRIRYAGTSVRVRDGEVHVTPATGPPADD